MIKNLPITAIFVLLVYYGISTSCGSATQGSSGQDEQNTQLVDLGGEMQNANRQVEENQAKIKHCEVPNNYELATNIGGEEVTPFSADLDKDGINDCVLICHRVDAEQAVDDCDVRSTVIIYLSAIKNQYYYLDLDVLGMDIDIVTFKGGILSIGGGEVDSNRGIELKSNGNGDMRLISYSESGGRGFTYSNTINLVSGQYKITESDDEGNEKVYNGKAQIPVYTLSNTDCHVFESLSKILSKNID